ncbi:MAG: hypothetical protein HC804_05185 [Anaerolineae bacterium]|nr:hypothetical protein [Anaerolineae bacterium]
MHGSDRLLALGRLDRLDELARGPYLEIENEDTAPVQLFSPEVGLAELHIIPNSPFIGQTIAQIGMRQQYGFNVLAVRRSESSLPCSLQDLSLQAEDVLLIQGGRARLMAARLAELFQEGLNVFVAEESTAVNYDLSARLLIARIPALSPLVGKSLAESNLGKELGLVALSIARGEQAIVAPSPEVKLEAGDVLLVEGDPDDLTIMRGLQGLVVKRHLHLDRVELESESVGLVEAVLSPYTTLVNKTLRDIHFRERYGVSVLAIWRNGRAYRSDLGNMTLQFGDAFLLYGPRQQLSLLASDADFLLLTEELEETPRQDKALPAILIMAGVVLVVVAGWLPIAIAAVIGATLIVLSGCLQMDEAYRVIEWRAVFLIAAMMPLGIAMQQSGAATFLANGMVALLGGWGGLAMLAGLFILTSVASQFMPNAVVTLLMAPIAINTAVDLTLSPYALMMTITIAASASFMSPVGHPANVLIMGPGGYRFTDYVRVGIPLTIVVLIVTLLVLPLVWPL